MTTPATDDRPEQPAPTQNKTRKPGVIEWPEVWPPNPLFTRDYAWSLPMSGQTLEVKIPAPGNAIAPADATDAIELLQLIIKRLQRDVARAAELERGTS